MIGNFLQRVGRGGNPSLVPQLGRKKFSKEGKGVIPITQLFVTKRTCIFGSNTLFLALLVGGHCYNLSERAWGGTPYSTIFFRKQHLQKGEDTPCRIMQLGIWRAPPWQRQRLTYRWFMGSDDKDWHKDGLWEEMICRKDMIDLIGHE